MTNDKIIKALECCEVRKKYFGATCVDCPFHDIGNCQSHLMTYTLHAIKQQEEEIVNLQEKLDYIENSLKTDFCGVPCDFMEEVANKQTKNAIKEFREKLAYDFYLNFQSNGLTNEDYNWVEDMIGFIENYTNEMVGENDDR